MKVTNHSPISDQCHRSFLTDHHVNPLSAGLWLEVVFFASSPKGSSSTPITWDVSLLPKAPFKEKLQGGAVPHQLALLPGDGGAEAAKAEQSPLEMDRIGPGGRLAQLQLACDSAIDPP